MQQSKVAGGLHRCIARKQPRHRNEKQCVPSRMVASTIFKKRHSVLFPCRFLNYFKMALRCLLFHFHHLFKERFIFLSSCCYFLKNAFIVSFQFRKFIFIGIHIRCSHRCFCCQLLLL